MLDQKIVSAKSAAMLILMGGKSTRMGTDKAQLLFDGQPFWEKIAKELSACGNVYISVSETRDTQPMKNYPCVRDLVPGAGIMGALHAAFHSIPEDLIFACACDMPFINHRMVEYLLNRWNAEAQKGNLLDGVAICDGNGRVYVSAALYHRRIFGQLCQNIHQNRLRMQSLVRDEANVLLIPMGEIQEFKSCLQNINTPEDYARLAVG